MAGIIHTFYLGSGETAIILAQAGRAGGFLGALFGGVAFKFLGFIAANVILFALFVIGTLVAFDIALHVLWPKKQLQEQPNGANAMPGQLKINTLSSQGFVKDKVIAANPKIQTEDTQASNTKSSREVISVNSLGKLAYPNGSHYY